MRDRYFYIGLGELAVGLILGGGVALFLTWLDAWEYQLAAGLSMTATVLLFHEWQSRRIARRK